MATGQGPAGAGGLLWTLSDDVPPFPALECLLAGSLFPDEPPVLPSFFGGPPSPPPTPPPPLPSDAALLGYPQEMQTSPTAFRSSSAIASSMEEMPTDNTSTESTGDLLGLQSSSIALERPADDGYNWRKYGQKALKGGECPKSYYRCSHGHGNCLVRKMVVHSAVGRIVQIIYRGQHSHERPSKRRFRDCGGPSHELDDFKDNEDALTKSQPDFPDCYGKRIMSNGTVTGCVPARREEEDEQLSGSCDSHEENDCEVQTGDGATGDADANERNAPAPGQKIIVSTTSEVDFLDDGYRWRKYGQKVVKRNPYPRSYYRCTYHGCDVKKHIERSYQEPNAVITTYEGKHIHDVPATTNRRHATATENTEPCCGEQEQLTGVFAATATAM